MAGYRHAIPLPAGRWRGRREFLAQFPGLATPEMQSRLSDPADPATFMGSKLDLGERQAHAEAYALHRDLLALRRDDPVLRHGHAGVGVDGATLGPEAFCLRFSGAAGEERLLLVNLGLAFTLEAAAEPLLAPPPGRRWELRWSSEAQAYGGEGALPLPADAPWRLAGHAAAFLATAEEAGSHG
jgi:maltooligosyltrehalose trehalohydrolase